MSHSYFLDRKRSKNTSALSLSTSLYSPGSLSSSFSIAWTLNGYKSSQPWRQQRNSEHDPGQEYYQNEGQEIGVLYLGQIWWSIEMVYKRVVYTETGSGGEAAIIAKIWRQERMNVQAQYRET